VSRWKLYRQRRKAKRNALLLFMLSGVVRSADVEIIRECMSSKHRRQAGSLVDPVSQATHSLWSMDVQKVFEGFFSKMPLGSPRRDLQADARTHVC
jgi:hypothetical protein